MLRGCGYLLLWAAMFWGVSWQIAITILFIVPAILIVAPTTFVFGVVSAFVVFLCVLLGWRTWWPLTLTPDNELFDRAGSSARRGAFGNDRAWPSYLFAPWRADLDTGREACVEILRSGWCRLNYFSRKAGWPFLWPILLIPYSAWLAITVGALAGGLLCTVVTATTLALVWLGRLSMVGLLWSVDGILQWRRQSFASCPSCFHVTALPAFQCSGCGQAHRDIRPGRFGVFWRRCLCRKRIPTTVFRAAKQLFPVCPRCDQPLRAGAASLGDVRLAIVGPVSAGKSRLLSAGLAALHAETAGSGSEMDFVGEDSRRAFQEGARVIRDRLDIAKTRPDQPRKPITACLKTARNQKLVHLFDAAVESHRDSTSGNEREFLEHAQGFAFTIDPFSARWVRDQTPDTTGLKFASITDVDHSYQVMARLLRDTGVDTRNRWLAITVVKADLMVDMPWARGLRSGGTREWLFEAGLDNVVLAAERDFAGVGYFVVSSWNLDDPAMSPADVFRWLLSRSGVVLPAGASRKVNVEGSA